MQKLARWQVTFIVGIVGFLVGTFVVFGSATVTSGSALIVLILTILHGLLARDTGKSPSNWASGVARHALQETRVLKAATMVVWVALVGITAYGIKQWSQTKHQRTVKGMVLDASERPVMGATVTLEVDNTALASTVTNNGMFEFSNTNLSGGKAFVVVSFRGREVRTAIRPEAAQSITVRITGADTRIRVAYYEIFGHALNFLLRGEVSPAWERVLGGQPYIVRNSTWTFLDDISTRFTAPFTDEFFTADPEDTDAPDNDKELGVLYKKNSNKRFFVGSWRPRLLFDTNADEADFKSITEGSAHWAVDRTDSDGNPSTFFWRDAARDDLSSFDEEDEPWVKFYEFLMDHDAPKHFSPIAIYHDLCGGWRKKLLFREMRLRVVVFENLSNEPIRLTSVAARSVARVQIRSEAQDEEAHSKAALASEALFPEPLAKSEKLLLPLQLVLAHDKTESARFPFSSLVAESSKHEWIGKIDPSRTYRLRQDVEGEPPVSIAGARLRDYAAVPRPGLDQVFVIGPSVTVDSVSIDNVPQTVRQAGRQPLFLRSGAAGGSCPIVYTHDKSGKWRRQGTILYGLKRPELAGRSRRKLHDFDGTVLIREEEPEASHINAVWIEAVQQDGTTTILRPKSDNLRAVDGQVVTIKPGQQIRVEFEKFSADAYARFELVCFGHYEPLRGQRHPQASRLTLH